MGPIARLREIAWIIAGGITGAVALVGLSVVLVLFISGAGAALPYLGHFIEKWTKQWTLEGPYIAFIAAGCVGFVFGAFVGKRHIHIIRKWFSAAIIGGIPMIFILWLFYACASGVRIPRIMKLADCTNSEINIYLKIPEGRNYDLVLASASDSTNTFLGHIHISSGASLIADFPISSELAEQCNWLGSIPSLSLTGFRNTNCLSLSQFIHAQREYNIEIIFDRSPPPSTSVWLHWVQAYKDKDK